MRNKDQLAPSGRGLGRVKHKSVGDGKNWIAQIGVHATDAIEIIARMTPATFLIHFPKFLGVVDQRAMLGTERQIKTRRKRHHRSIPRRQRVKAEIRLTMRGHFKRIIGTLQSARAK